MNDPDDRVLGAATQSSAELALPTLLNGLPTGGCRKGFHWRVVSVEDHLRKDIQTSWPHPGATRCRADEVGPRLRKITIELIEAP